MVLDFKFVRRGMVASAWRNNNSSQTDGETVRQRDPSPARSKVVKSVLASLPGGDGLEDTRNDEPKDHNNAYKHIVKKLTESGFDTMHALGTVWFGKELVWGMEVSGGDGLEDTWVHPIDRECGRDDKSCEDAPDRSHLMWSFVEGEGPENRSIVPVRDKRYKCWCCRWMRKFDKLVAEGYELHIVTSNISCWADPVLAAGGEGDIQDFCDADPEYARAYVKATLNQIESVNRYGAGSSCLPSETFRNIPEDWRRGYGMRESRLDVLEEDGTVFIKHLTFLDGVCLDASFGIELRIPTVVVADLVARGHSSMICLKEGAEVHPHTKKPLGSGCRWERQVLDAKPYRVWVYESL